MDVERTLIGRESAWAALTLGHSAAASGSGGLVLLAGEAGVGKTRLATDALDRSGLFTLAWRANPTTGSSIRPARRGAARLSA